MKKILALALFATLGFSQVSAGCFSRKPKASLKGMVKAKPMSMKKKVAITATVVGAAVALTAAAGYYFSDDKQRAELAKDGYAWLAWNCLKQGGFLAKEGLANASSYIWNNIPSFGSTPTPTPDAAYGQETARLLKMKADWELAQSQAAGKAAGKAYDKLGMFNWYKRTMSRHAYMSAFWKNFLPNAQ